MFLLSGVNDEFLGSFQTENLAEEAAWKYSEKEGLSKDKIFAYMEDNN